MLSQAFLFFGSMHGICDALLLLETGWKGFLLYGTATFVIYWSSARKSLFYMYGCLTVFPAFYHFLNHDGVPSLFFLVPAVVYPRRMLQLYFIFVHSWSPTLKCCLKAYEQNRSGLLLWTMGSITVPLYFGKSCINNPIVLDRLLLSVTIPHILLNGLKSERCE
jgi:hypothetical protein